MNTLEFRTNVCSECCIRNLANYFSDTKIKYWNVNLHHPLKVLTMHQLILLIALLAYLRLAFPYSSPKCLA